jgi:hypothetical protein
VKLIQIPPSTEIQIIALYLFGTYFSLKLGVTRSCWPSLIKFQVPKIFQSNFP